MAKIIQLELAFVGVSAPTPALHVCPADNVRPTMMCAADSVVSDTCAMYDAMALRQGVSLTPYGPCKSCPLLGLCDADECGMKCFDLDSDRSCQGSWDGYFEHQMSQVRSWLESHPFTL